MAASAAANMTDMTLPFPDAFVILSGGRAQRLGGSGGPAGTDRTDDADDGGDAGGTDKASIALGGRTLLDRALGTTQGRPVVIVGPHAPARPRVTLTREDPPGGGPAARHRPRLATFRVGCGAVRCINRARSVMNGGAVRADR